MIKQTKIYKITNGDINDVIAVGYTHTPLAQRLVEIKSAHSNGKTIKGLLIDRTQNRGHNVEDLKIELIERFTYNDPILLRERISLLSKQLIPNCNGSNTNPRHTYLSSKIFKLTDPENNIVYIGSTLVPLPLYFRYLLQRPKFSHIFEQHPDLKIELIEDFPCASIEELKRRTQEHQINLKHLIA